MNLKKKFLTAVSTFAIVVSMLAPSGAAAPAQIPQSDTATGVVQVADAGMFSVSICEVTGDRDFGTVGVSTIASGTGEARLTICYVDTMMNRPGFLTNLSAGEWTTTGLPSVLTPTNIPAENLIPIAVYGPVSQQLLLWYQGGSIYGDGVGVANPVLVGTTPGVTGWDRGALDTPQQVGHGDQGRGTTSTTAQVDLRLTVPANTWLGTYTTTITVDIAPRVG